MDTDSYLLDFPNDEVKAGFVTDVYKRQVVRYATFCLCFGAEKEEAVKHMADKFGGEYADTERVARDVYKRQTLPHTP